MSTLRDEAALAGRMAFEMQKKLATHSDRPHWRQSDLGFLIERLAEEVGELIEEAHGMRYDVWSEAADVANFAAMIADLCVGGTDE